MRQLALRAVTEEAAEMAELRDENMAIRTANAVGKMLSGKR